MAEPVEVFEPGEVAELTAQFYNDAGAPADPTTTTLTIIDPLGVSVPITDWTPIGHHPGVGSFFYPLTIGDFPDGIYEWNYAGIGNVSVKSGEGFLLVGTGIRTGPCEEWCTWAEVTACRTDLAAADGNIRALAIETATEILWNLTERRYSGLCKTTRSLCMACSGCGGGWAWDGGWWGSSCRCAPSESIYLGPNVRGVLKVTVLGVDLPRSAYRVDDGRLVRIDNLPWPGGTDLTDPAAFRATWVAGNPIPRGARRAAAKYAAEIAAQCLKKACQLPERVTSVVREGVSYTILDSLKMIDEGRTGLPSVDLWIGADRRGQEPGPGMSHPLLRDPARQSL